MLHQGDEEGLEQEGQCTYHLSHVQSEDRLPDTSERGFKSQYQSLVVSSYSPGYSKTAAAPIPVPMHMDTTPYALQSKEHERNSFRHILNNSCVYN